jgi:hypothetical protein
MALRSALVPASLEMSSTSVASEVDMSANGSVANMSFEDWKNRNGKFGAKTWKDLIHDPVISDIDDGLREAVAYYLYIESKDVADDKAGLYRAAALALIEKPVDPELLSIASARRSEDDPLYNDDYGANPTLFDLWEYHHRAEIGSRAR